MPKMFAEEDLDAFQRLRCAFDPQGLANPGKVMPTPRLCGEVPGPYREHPLEAAGLAERRPSPTDRRARVIAVTAAGRRKVREAEEIAARVHEDVLAALPAKQRQVFLDALVRLVSGRLAEPAECASPPRRRAPRG
jgi:hypothetical protein